MSAEHPAGSGLTKSTMDVLTDLVLDASNAATAECTRISDAAQPYSVDDPQSLVRFRQNQREWDRAHGKAAAYSDVLRMISAETKQ